MNRTMTAARPITWLLALPLAVVLGQAVLHWALWPVASFEDTRNFGQVVFGQTYRAARKIHSPKCDGRPPIVLLGNSRVQFAAREEPLRRALRELDPQRDFCILNLGIFGAAIGDLEVIERHLERLDPALVILAIDESSLQATSQGGLRNVPASLMNVGWSDGPLSPDGIGERVDRWLRTAWPVYRFREFIRAAILDRILPDETSQPWPRRFDSMVEFFRYAHGGRADAVLDAHRQWRRRGDLAGFIDFLEIDRSDYFNWVRQRAATPPSSEDRALALAVLDELLERMGRDYRQSLVLVLPRNPLLEEDLDGELFDRQRADEAIVLIEKTAAVHGVPVIDAKSWMPAEAFFDFDHLVPDLARFEEPLAEELVDVLHAG